MKHHKYQAACRKCGLIQDVAQVNLGGTWAYVGKCACCGVKTDDSNTERTGPVAPRAITITAKQPTLF